MVDWEALFREIGVTSTTRGANTSRGNVNIRCPFCRDDPSTHLGVALNGNGYFCYRSPSKHSGKSLPYLLIKLGVPSGEIDRLLAKHTSREKTERAPLATPIDHTHIQTKWDRFEPASTSQHCLDYLAWRGFEDPTTLADNHDLRYARLGHWSGRLLIPYYEHNHVISWSGRSLHNREPKYLAQHSDGAALLYVPLTHKQYHVGIVTEGPLDALKVASVGEAMGVHAAGLSGKSITDAKRVRLAAFFQSCTICLLALDADVSMSEIMVTTATLATLTPGRYIRRARLPEGRKDPGEMEIGELREWLTAVISPRR